MRILIANDDATVLDALKRSLSSLTTPDGQPVQVIGAHDADGAIEALKGPDSFHVVVTDMDLGGQEQAGLRILNELADRSPITIVFATEPNVPDSVAAMKAGAWDYLAKPSLNGKEPYEALRASITAALEARIKNPDLGKPNPDSVWISEHIDELVANYPGEIVAVLDRKIVAHASSYEALQRDLDKYIYALPCMIAIPPVLKEPAI